MSANETLKVLITADAKGFSSAVQGMSKEIGKINKDFEGLSKVGEGMKSVGKKLTMGLTLPIAGVAGASAKMSMDFEKSFAKVSTLLDSSSTDFDKYKKDIKNASKEMGVGIGEYSEALYQSMSAGVDAGDAIKFTSDMVKLAKGGFTETATAVDLVTTVLNSYGKEAGSTTDIMDKLIQTQNTGKTTVGELSESMGKLIPIANGASVGFDDMLASMATLTAGGISTAESTTYLKSMINELSKSGTQVSDILKKETGMSFQELNEKGIPLGETLGTLKKYADDNGLAFNDLFGSSEAATAAMALMKDEGVSLGEKLDLISNSAGSANEAFEKVEDTAGAKLSKAFNAVKVALIEIGDALAPLIEKFAEFAEKVAEWIGKFGELDESTQIFILAVAGILALLGPLIGFIGSCISVFIGLSAASVILGIGMFPIIGIIVGVIAVIVLLIGAGIWLCQNWETVKKASEDTWNTVMETVTLITDTIVNALVDAWNGVKDFLSGCWDGIKTACSDIFNSIKDLISSAWDSVSSVTSSIWNAIKGICSSIWNGLKGVASSVFDSISSVVSTAWNAISSTTSTVWNAITGTTSKAWNAVKKAISDPIDKAKDAVSKGVEAMKKFLDISLPFPKIKLPHFSISGNFSLNPPSIPTFGVKWYSKGAIFKRPTVMGGVGVGDKHRGIGGNAEAVLPIDKLPKLLGLDKMQQGGLTLHIENFHNNTDKDMEQLASDLAFYMQRQSAF